MNGGNREITELPDARRVMTLIIVRNVMLSFQLTNHLLSSIPKATYLLYARQVHFNELNMVAVRLTHSLSSCHESLLFEHSQGRIHSKDEVLGEVILLCM